MYKAYKYRIYPNKEQQEKMFQFFGCTRFIYNKCIEWYSDAYKQWKENETPISKTPLVTYFKKDYEFLKDCDNAALAYARENFNKAINDFFKSRNGKRKGKRLGFPKFKKKGVSKYIYKTCDAHGGIKFNEENNKLRLPKIGWVKIIKHRGFNGIIKAVSVECTKSNKFYVSIMVETDATFEKIQIPSNRQIAVGLDMSLSQFAVSSNKKDNMINKYCRNYRQEEKRLAKLNRQMSRKVKGSKNRDKARIKYARLCEKVANRRKDYIVKMALYYAKRYENIVIEDLNMQAMSRTLKLGKSVMDLGWGAFTTWIKWQCEKYHTNLIVVDKWFASSKICNACGEKNSLLKLSDREWVCPHCGTIIDRDYNAACNLQDYYLKNINTAGIVEINAYGDETSTFDSMPNASIVDEIGSPSL